MRSLLLPVSLMLAGCAVPGSVTLVSSAHATISASDLELPTSLRDDSTMPARLQSVPCGSASPAMPTCPDLGASAPTTLECSSANVCDPAPATVEAPVPDVVDIDMASGDLHSVLSVIDSIEIQSIHVSLSDETLTFDVAPIDVYWGSEGATTAPLGNHLAQLPGIPAGTSTGDFADADVDSAGSASLSDYLVHTSHRVRLFARTTVDIAPGALFPAGSLGVDVIVTLVARGRVTG